ncbi:MAG: glycosyltransferase [Anaerolineales bacterium]|nr:glycosyltransferase [Anaerolineales bacterium]
MIKIALSLPVDPRTLTHGARMVCDEFITALARQEHGFELELIGPEQVTRSFGSIPTFTVPESASAWRTLKFEQYDLPGIVKASGADVLLMPYSAAPLGSPVPVVLFEVLGRAAAVRGFAGRLLHAARRAGAQGAARRLIYSDLPIEAANDPNILTVRPRVHTSFRTLPDPDDRSSASRRELPPGYVLAHGVSLEDVPLLLAAWTWVDGSVGDTVPLAALVSEGIESRVWEDQVHRMGLAHSVHLLKEVEFDELPALYRQAGALLQGGRSLEHQIMRWAMACGVPVTGFDTPAAADVLGPAGYLVAPGDTRALGAACLTVIVEPEVKVRLRKDALMRASAFHKGSDPAETINELLERLVG